MYVFGDTRVPDRIWAKVFPEPNTGCWFWAGALTRDGYSSVKFDGRSVPATRPMYCALVGPLLSGEELDHQCPARSCVNPAHVKPATHKVNSLRSATAPPALNSLKTHCLRGHAFDVENTYFRAGRYGRRCRECVRYRKAAWKRLREGE